MEGEGGAYYVLDCPIPFVFLYLTCGYHILARFGFNGIGF